MRLGPAAAVGLATDWNQMVTWALSFATCEELNHYVIKNELWTARNDPYTPKSPKLAHRMIMMIAVAFAVLLPCVSIHSMMPRILIAH